MDKSKIIDFLENIVELEKQVYLQKEALNQLDSKINSLSSQDAYQRSCIEPEVDYSSVSYSVAGLFIIGLLCGWVIGFILSLIFGNAILIILTCGLFGGVIGCIIAIRHNCSYKNSIPTETEKVSERLKLENDMRIQENSRQIDFLMAERRSLYDQHLNTCNLLDNYYSTNIIYGKYQHNFVAVASFLDYFKSGRCSTLGENRGGDGAYNMYESELRQNIIINKLDLVIENLSEIQQNQYSLVLAISEGNKIAQDLVNATERLALAQERTAENSAIAAYNSERSANELNQIKWLQLWEQMN